MQAPGSKNIQVWDGIIGTAIQIPGSKISRDEFLRKELSKHCDVSQVLKAIEKSPAEAGISSQTIRKISESVISSHRLRTSSISAAAGLPGGWWAAGTIPTDITQFFWNVTVVSQKLAYLHGWPALDDNLSSETDERTKEVLTLFIGVMFGVNAANVGITRLSAQIASEATKHIPNQALTKTFWYPIVKKVASSLGYKMTKNRAGQIIGKVVPVVGAAISGGITWFSFGSMASRLHNHLEGLYLHTRKSEDLEKEKAAFEKLAEVDLSISADEEVVEHAS